MVRSTSPNTLVSSNGDRTRPTRAIEYDQLEAVSEVWALLANSAVAQQTAVHDPHVTPAVKLTYRELYQQIQQFASGLQALGIQAGEHVALFSDNSPRWLVADQGIMTVGAINVVRGSQADAEELLFILADSDSIALVVQDSATFEKVANELHTLPIRLAIVLSDEAVQRPEGLSDDFRLLTFRQVCELAASHTLQPAHRKRDTLATLMYTSGTSGKPKGVMLNHSNLLSQISGAAAVVKLEPGDRVLSILPIWHCYERTFEYFIFAHGCTQIYTNIRHVKKDLKDFKPHYMVGVPRLWESIYEGVQKQFREQPANRQKLVNFFVSQSLNYIQARRIVEGISLEKLHPSALEKLVAWVQMTTLWGIHQLGDRLIYRQIRAGVGGEIKYVVSGGGSIAEHLEDFFEAVGITILGGYGLTETSPITHVRRPSRNLRGGDGQPLPYTETRIVDPDTRRPVAVEKQGLVLIRGHQVMQGYYKNPQATAKAIDPEGWFDTGDLGWVTAQADLIITGRAKDTIVLTNGENIEPQPIEDACLRSPYIDQIMLVGQDQRSLGALIVPNLEALAKWAQAQNPALQLPDGSLDLQQPAIQTLFRQELAREVKNRPGYRADDRIGPFRLLSEPFTIDNGLLTQTLKIRRLVVTERYRGMIDDMFAA
jgi:long-chain acyl-CoA synthetase